MDLLDIFYSNWFSFFITGLGTLLLIGEILVRARGIFGLLGISLMTVYFWMYVQSSTFLILFVIYIIGLLLIIIDGKFISDGTLGVLGLVSMLFAIGFAAPDLYTGLYAVIGVFLGGAASFSLLKVFKPRNMWSKLTLKDSLTSEAGYNSMNDEYLALVNLQGMTLNDLRPVGTIRINGKEYSAVSNGQWIPKNSMVKVVQVDGTKILVEPINNEKETT